MFTATFCLLGISQEQIWDLVFLCKCGLLLWLVRTQHAHYESKRKRRIEELVCLPIIWKRKRKLIPRFSFVIIFVRMVLRRVASTPDLSGTESPILNQESGNSESCNCKVAAKVALNIGRFAIPHSWHRAQKPLKPGNTKKIGKSHEIPHPGSGPENTKKTQKNTQIARKWPFSCFFCFFFSYFRGPTRGGEFHDFFVFFSYFRAWGVLSSIPGTQNRNARLQFGLAILKRFSAIPIFCDSAHCCASRFVKPLSDLLEPPKPRKNYKSSSEVYKVQMDAAVLGDRLPEGTQKPLLGPGSPSLQCWHWESSKVLAGLAFCETLSQYPQSVFRGSAGDVREGQQQFATQTLRVHLLGLEKVTKKRLWGPPPK